MSETRPISDSPAGRYRWLVISALLAAITAINYLDRQTLSIVIGEVKKEIAIDEVQYGRMTSMFLLGYALMYAGGGWLVDRLGTRVGYLVIAAAWSLACGAHALAGTAFGFIAARFFLGLAEGGGFPASAKAVSEWFPARERSFAVGIVNTGSAVGSTIAPPLVASVALEWGWRTAFVTAGALGLAWAAVWTWIYRPARDCRRLGVSERQYLVDSNVGETGPAPERESWWTLLGIREVQILMLARFLTGGPWFFMIFWFPKYLIDVWQFDTKQVGWYGWLPYAFAGVGSFIGGWLSSRLIQKGMNLDGARRLSLGLSAALLPAAVIIAFSRSLSAGPGLAIACACMAFLGHQSWSVLMHTLTLDLFPSRLVGSAAGVIGMAEAAGSAVFAEVIGRVLESTGRDYMIPFVITGVLHPIAFGILALSIRRIDLLERFRSLAVRPAVTLTA